MKLNLSEPCSSLFLSIQSKLGRENVFLVGGFVRDSLLRRESMDLDIAFRTDDFSFAKSLFADALIYPKFQTITFKEEGFHVTLARMRKEKDYLDHRHPSCVEFVSSIEEDCLRRDFTINALYLPYTLEILDPLNQGLKDIEEKKIRLIGEKRIRLLEDPLRIIRAYRFSYELGFSLELETAKAIMESKDLISYLNPQKAREEISKVDKVYQKEMMKEFYFPYFDI